ncbi:MAG: stress response translation initiation inhibitor YciH [Thermoplasmata archaeon]|nr:stress response translation initiation inhibitor YciH [Thermoplasmata archaeon]
MKKSSTGLPKELTNFDELATQQVLKVYTDRRRYGKTMTIIEGFDSSVDLKELAKELKHSVAAGGTFKDERIELQGDHREKVKKILQEMGFIVEDK